MLKHIFIQFWNRRRANAWLLVELLLVFCLLWYIVDYLFVLEYNRSLPSCRNLAHTWRIDVDLLPEEDPDYQPGQSDSTALEVNYDRVLDRIRHFKDVEALTVLHQWNAPGSGGYACDPYRNVQDTARVGQIISFFFDYRTDFFRVFGYTTSDGKPVSVNDFDWSDPQAVVVGSLTGQYFAPTGQAVGMLLESVQNPADRLLVKGVVGEIKRQDFERPHKSYYKPIHLEAATILSMEIAVRSREGLSDARFLQTFKEEMQRELRIGNFYLREVQLYSKRMDDIDTRFGLTKDIKLHTAMMLFFLVNILLGIIGTFWYRIRTRQGEIGLRMAMGSTRWGIRGLFLMEGLCLLSVVTLPALFIEAQLVYAGLIDTLGRFEDNVGYFPDRTLLRFLLTNILTWLVLAATILIAIWLPAGKAAGMAPAEALHYE